MVSPGPVILDTDTLSELCRGNLRVKGHALAYLKAFGRITTTAVTVFERLRGYELALREGKPFHAQFRAFEGLVATCIVLPFDGTAAAMASRIWSSISRARRHHIGDILIASIALSRQMPLVTRNQKHFRPLFAAAGRSDGLVDWTRTSR